MYWTRGTDTRYSTNDRIRLVNVFPANRLALLAQNDVSTVIVMGRVRIAYSRYISSGVCGASEFCLETCPKTVVRCVTVGLAVLVARLA